MKAEPPGGPWSRWCRPKTSLQAPRGQKYGDSDPGRGNSKYKGSRDSKEASKGEE